MRKRKTKNLFLVDCRVGSLEKRILSAIRGMSVDCREATITRMAVETKAEAEERVKKGSAIQTMGRKTYVPYGLYRLHGFISAPLAKQTGFSEEDLELFWDALLNMFDHDRSAARGEMATQKLIVFKHASELGNAPAQKLFKLVMVEKNCGEKPPRTFTDYDVFLGGKKLDGVGLSDEDKSQVNGVEIIEML